MNKVRLEKSEIKRLENILFNFKKKRIMVIGDLILDEFIWGDVSRISPEAPVPVVLAQSGTFKLGGACNVANNVCALDGFSYLAGIIGNDSRGKELLNNLKNKGVNIDGILVDKSRVTTLKTRIVARQRNQQVVRIDKETTKPLSKHIMRKLLDKIIKNIPEVDAIVLEDYGKGVITPLLLETILKEACSYGKKIIVDPKKHHFDYYKGVTLITPNKNEIEDATDIKISDRNSLQRAAKSMFSKLQCKAILVTLGEKGMCLFTEEGEVEYIESVAQDVFDVSGAGDTVVSAFAQSIVSDASLKEAAIISNFAAGIVVGKFGTATVSRKELLDKISNSFKK